MASGLIGYMSYDAIRLIETSIPAQNFKDLGLDKYLSTASGESSVEKK